MALRLTLRRLDASPSRTIGELAIGAGFLCWTLEDALRPVKIPGETCIPAGRYRVLMTRSTRFRRMMPLLLEVPEFTGVRIHGGNTAADTAGCILVGAERGEDSIYRCQPALDRLCSLIATAQARSEEVSIEVLDPPVYSREG